MEKTRIPKGKYKTILRNMLKEIMKKSLEENENQKMFKEFMRYRGCVNFAKHLNVIGSRVITDSKIGKRKYTSQDLTEYFANKVNQADIDIELSLLVEYLVNYVGHSKWDQRVERGLKIILNKRISEKATNE